MGRGRHLTHHRKTLEASLDHEALLTYVNEWRKRSGKGYWRRRWRVEGGQAGNSYLLELNRAEKTKAKHGGRIVEVIPLLRPPRARRPTP